MMSKHKKMLLISSLILLASCGQIPEPPEASKITPIWHEPEPGVVGIKYFYGRWMKSGNEIKWSNADAKAMGLVCTDTESYAREEMYLRQMRKLAEKRCK